MRRRDPLLGPTNPGETSAGPGSKHLILLSLVVGIAVACFLAGRWWADRGGAIGPAPTAVRSAQPAVRTATTQVAPTAAKAAPIKPERIFILKPLTDADSDKVGAGCRCSFYPRGGKTEVLSAGGDDLAIFRPDGVRKICPLKEESLQSMFEGDARIACGSSRLRIKEIGEKRPGLDGHSSAARLTVIHSGVERVIDGTWGCFC